jgi:hypothetical protein
MPAAEIVGPASRPSFSQRLRLHDVDRGNEDRPLLLLVRGGRDHARSWDAVARELRHDWHGVAPDLRGHGDRAWALAIVAHSLGGAIWLSCAGACSESLEER